MNTTIHSSFLPQTDPDSALAFYRDLLGFEVRLDVGYGGMRWLTVGSPAQPDTAVVLYPLEADTGVTDDERFAITQMMAKGSYARVTLATEDLDETFARLRDGGADVVQEPTDQPWGDRDFAVRDPSGNVVRINQRM